MATDESRRWRLQAWNKAGEVIHDGTCVGDRDLDTTSAALEQRKDFKRFTVTAEFKAVRQQVKTVEGAPPQDDHRPPPACRECNLPEPECRRREAISGHAFQATGIPA